MGTKALTSPIFYMGDREVKLTEYERCLIADSLEVQASALLDERSTAAKLKCKAYIRLIKKISK